MTTELTTSIPTKVAVPPTLLFLGTFEDKEYTPHLKQMVGAARVFVSHDNMDTLTELRVYCEKRNITGVFTTNTNILSRLIGLISSDVKVKPSLSNYAGSLFTYYGIDIVIIEPLKLFMSVSYQKFVTRRYLSKLISPESWYNVPEFNFTLVTPSNFDAILRLYEQALFIAVDIETVQENLAIVCIGYTAVFIHNGRVQFHSCVLPIDSMYAVTQMRKLNWIKVPKAFQNGKYDCAYLARYNAPVWGYYYDTINMFHCWYAELPKDLTSITAFNVRNVVYWKDLSKTNDKYEYYKYNALDTHGTAASVLNWIMEAPQWAKQNYCMEFPLVFPCHMSELIGIKRDMEVLVVAQKEYEDKIFHDTIALSKMVGVFPAVFNTNSHLQVTALRKILGCADIPNGDETALKKVASRHPLNARIINKILDIRGHRKLVSTYLTPGKELNGRILYALNPHGTDTGRLASREHQFWCGLQIQNITRGKSVKQTLIADPGFLLAECDLKQAETRDTAYLSGDTKLIAAISSSRDFHALNASAFFGVPYEAIFDDTNGKTLDKPLRDLSKRVNHGANYLMGVNVLIDTMGEDKVWEAKRLLKLPVGYGLKDVAAYLLTSFHATYPTLESTYYPHVVAQVVKQRMLVGATGWTRYCFGDPVKDKRAKNAYVAHVSQSLNAMALNIAYLKVFYEIALHPDHCDNFKLCAQIHDSILFQFREGHEYLAEAVAKLMAVPITVTAATGVTYTFTVPADVKAGEDGKGAKRWSETE